MSEKHTTEIRDQLLRFKAAVDNENVAELIKLEPEFNRLTEKLHSQLDARETISTFDVDGFLAGDIGSSSQSFNHKSLPNLLLIERTFKLRNPDKATPFLFSSLWKLYSRLCDVFKEKNSGLPFSWQITILDNFVQQYAICCSAKIKWAATLMEKDEEDKKDQIENLDSFWRYEEISGKLLELSSFSGKDTSSPDGRRSFHLSVAAKCALVRHYVTSGNAWQGVSTAKEVLRLRQAMQLLTSTSPQGSSLFYYFGVGQMVLRNYRDAYDAFTKAMQNNPTNKAFNHCLVICSIVLGRTFADDHQLEKLSDLSYRLSNSENPEAVAESYEEALKKGLPHFVSPISVADEEAVRFKIGATTELDWRFKLILKDVMQCAWAAHVRSFAILYNLITLEKCSSVTHMGTDLCRERIIFDSYRRFCEKRRYGRELKHLVVNKDTVNAVTVEESDILLCSILKKHVDTKRWWKDYRA